MKLEVTSSYEKEGDTILIEVYLYDEVTNLFVPNQIESGIAKIYFGENLVYTLLFDRRMGNSDGSIKLLVSHPIVFSDLVLVTYVKLLASGLEFTKTGPIVQAALSVTDSPEEQVPLVEQPENRNPGYRSLQRIAENVIE